MTFNTRIATIFRNIGNMLEILCDNPFKVRAYINAAKTVSLLEMDLHEFSDQGRLMDIRGIGKDLANKIKEFSETGQIEYYEELKSRVPEELLKLKNIQGIGPKILQTLFNDFNVRNISDLENTLSDPEFINSKGMGNKKINELKVGIKLFKSHLKKINLGFAVPTAEYLKNEFLNIPYILNVEIAGGLMRGKETVELINLVVYAKDHKSAAESILNLPFINKNDFIIKNSTLNFTLNSGIPVRIDFTNENNFININFIKTGSVKHVARIINMYKEPGKDFYIEKFNDQEDIYKKVGLQYIYPELREGWGEIELAGESGFQRLIELSDIKGDLHTHSTWSDGKSGIKEMADAAKKLGYEYIAITDHSVSSRIANGLDISRLKEKKIQLQEIDASTEGIKIIYGSEVDIKPDGSLDYPNEILRELDMVVASVHSNFKMEEKEMTRRITKALSNPYVSALGHPTGRLIGERNPYNVDINAVIETAKKYGKALEVNSSFMRLDLKDEHVRLAIENGIKLIISTDAHHTDQLKQMRYGISTARRGSAGKEQVINTLPLKDLVEWLKTFK